MRIRSSTAAAQKKKTLRSLICLFAGLAGRAALLPGTAAASAAGIDFYFRARGVGSFFVRMARRQCNILSLE